ncbi:hypothetical protein ACROYT_G003879 [Oculina patagonica]
MANAAESKKNGVSCRGLINLIIGGRVGRTPEELEAVEKKYAVPLHYKNNALEESSEDSSEEQVAAAASAAQCPCTSKRSHHKKKKCPVENCKFEGADLQRHLKVHTKRGDIEEAYVEKLLSIVSAGVKQRGSNRIRKGNAHVKGKWKKWCPIPGCDKLVLNVTRHLCNPSMHNMKKGSREVQRLVRMAKRYTSLAELDDNLVKPPPPIVEESTHSCQKVSAGDDSDDDEDDGGHSNTSSCHGEHGSQASQSEQERDEEDQEVQEDKENEDDEDQEFRSNYRMSSSSTTPALKPTGIGGWLCFFNFSHGLQQATRIAASDCNTPVKCGTCWKPSIQMKMTSS